jgi:hypothetical protein
MPKKMEQALRKKARAKWPKNKERQDKYVYGAMRKAGWKPSRKK